MTTANNGAVKIRVMYRRAYTIVDRVIHYNIQLWIVYIYIRHGHTVGIYPNNICERADQTYYIYFIICI